MIKDIKKIILFIFIFYVLVLVQTGFLAHFKIPGIFSNLTLFAVIVINIFASCPQEKIFSALAGGFWLDVFSLSDTFGFFGFYALTLFAASFFWKIILEKYFRFSFAGLIGK